MFFTRFLTFSTLTGILWVIGLVTFAMTAFRPAYDGVWLMSSIALVAALICTIRLWLMSTAENERLELERLNSIANTERISQ